jgi:Cu(I)/Ag(I) efflux system membrane protein CusA/SilA
VNLRYSRELRDNLTMLRRVLVPTPSGAQIPLEQLAKLEIRKGPPSIKSENARLNAWVYVDLEGVDVGTWVSRARQTLSRELTLPAGYSLVWSGQYEYMQRAAQRLRLVGPVTLGLIFLLLYLNFRRLSDTLIVMATLPFGLVGGVWLLWALGYDLSVAVGVGFIALAGVSAELGVVLLIFLEEAVERFRSEGRLRTKADVLTAVREGAGLRVRPIMMTVTCTTAGLLPIMWGAGTGSETMRRIAAPMVGGLVSATVLTLVVIPAIYLLWRRWQVARRPGQSVQEALRDEMALAPAE